MKKYTFYFIKSYLLSVVLLATTSIRCTNKDHDSGKNIHIDVMEELKAVGPEYSLARLDYISDHYEEKESFRESVNNFAYNVLYDKRSNEDERRFALYILTDFQAHKSLVEELDYGVEFIYEVDKYSMDILSTECEETKGRKDMNSVNRQRQAQYSINSTENLHTQYKQAGDNLEKKKQLIYSHMYEDLLGILDNFGFEEMTVLFKTEHHKYLQDIELLNIFYGRNNINDIGLQFRYMSIVSKLFELTYNLCQDFYDPDSEILLMAEKLTTKYLEDENFRRNNDNTITFLGNSNNYYISHLRRLRKKYIQHRLSQKHPISKKAKHNRANRGKKQQSKPKSKNTKYESRSITSIKDQIGSILIKSEIIMLMKEFSEAMIAKRIKGNNNNNAFNRFITHNQDLYNKLSSRMEFILNNPFYNIGQEIDIYYNDNMSQMTIINNCGWYISHFEHRYLILLTSFYCTYPKVDPDIIRNISIFEKELTDRLGIVSKGAQPPSLEAHNNRDLYNIEVKNIIDDIMDDLRSKYEEYTLNNIVDNTKINFPGFVHLATSILARNDCRQLIACFRHDDTMPQFSVDNLFNNPSIPKPSAPRMFMRDDLPAIPNRSIYFHNSPSNNSKELQNDPVESTQQVSLLNEHQARLQEDPIHQNMATGNSSAISHTPEITVDEDNDDLNDSDYKHDNGTRIYDLLDPRIQDKIRKVFNPEEVNPRNIKGSAVISLINYLNDQDSFLKILRTNKVSFSKYTREHKAYLTAHTLLKITLDNIDHSKAQHTGRKNKKLDLLSGRRIIQLFDNIGILPR